MNGWHILGIALATLILFLSIPVGVWVQFDGELLVRLRIGFLRLQLIPGKGKKTRGKKKQPGKEAKKGRERKLPTRDQLFYSVDRLGKVLAKVLKKVLRGLRIEPLCLRLVVAGEDPADTAILYGKVCAAVGSVLPLLKQGNVIRGEEIRVSLDFDRTEWVCFARAGIYMRLWKLFEIAFFTIFCGIGWYLGYRERAAKEMQQKATGKQAAADGRTTETDSQAPAA